MQSQKIKILFTTLLILVLGIGVLSGGNVYLVIGSDTAIWDGMSTSRFHCFYNIDLYTNPQRNAYKVMDPAFRARLVDSDGNPLKMTWWMMAGNIFRYATNKNMPIPNIMTMYLMKTYHGKEVRINGDELSLHYHTFRWYDYNHDGRFYWNQAQKFMDCFDDFNYTLAQYLLEEQVFPVSFRSGWHYMDNDWQHYLDDYILPYSMHNAYPTKHTDTEEPLDNIYDWSQAPSAFVPFHPSRENYQIPGNGKGWNVRSAHFRQVINDDLLDTVFTAAQNGVDQVACFWGHLPEKDFIENIERIDSLAHAKVANYSGVKFYYCTATEAMQRWRGSKDNQPPSVDFSAKTIDDNVYFLIRSDEPIFQKQPFVAVKDIYENYKVLNCLPVGLYTWQTSMPIPRDELAKAAVAVCDTMGNQTLKFIRLLPDDAFIDNQDNLFETIYGSWQTITSGTPWGTDALVAVLTEGDSVSAQWSYSIPKTTYYNVFVQIPKAQNVAPHLQYIIKLNDSPPDTIFTVRTMEPNNWNYLKTINGREGDRLIVQLKAFGTGQVGKNVLADAVKISALVRKRDLRVNEQIIDFAEISWGDTAKVNLNLQNLGTQELTVEKVEMPSKEVFTQSVFPFKIPAMSKAVLPIYFYSEKMGSYSDSLTIVSNDPKNPKLKIAVEASVQNYFEIVDNDDVGHYDEFGTWYNSVAQANGLTSRFTWLNQHPAPYARFFTNLKKSGVYELFEIVPKTINSTDRALYEISIDGVVLDSLYIDQNKGSGNWVSLGKHYFPAAVPVQIRVIDSGQSTQGAVLRADAVKFLLIREITDVQGKTHNVASTFRLQQNYPNPFNSVTTIRYRLAKRIHVRITIFDMTGRTVRTLVNAQQNAGMHQLIWYGRNEQGSTVSSGIYYYRMETNGFNLVKKMILLK